MPAKRELTLPSAAPAVSPEVAWPALPAVAALQGLSLALHTLAVAQRLQQQSLCRQLQRGQELSARHGQCLASPLDCLDLPLASTRWALQEWDQSWQDLILAALSLRGDVLTDPLLARYLPQPWLDAGAAPVLDAWGELLEVQLQAWKHLMEASRRRWRAPAWAA